MPKYFFDIHDGCAIRDDIGRNIEGGGILRAEAVKVATMLMREEAETGNETTLVLTVRDEAGGTPLTVRLVCQVSENRPIVPHKYDQVFPIR